MSPPVYQKKNERWPSGKKVPKGAERRLWRYGKTIRTKIMATGHPAVNGYRTIKGHRTDPSI